MCSISDFIYAALPWIAIGISIALITVNFKKKKKDEKESDYVTTGICLGMCFGVAIGSSLTDTFGESALTYGICFGMLFGVVTGSFMSRNRKKSNEQKISKLSGEAEDKKMPAYNKRFNSVEIAALSYLRCYFVVA